MPNLKALNKISLDGDPTEALHPATKQYVDAAGVPTGTIVAYGAATAPTGWHLCDGTAHGSSALQTLIGSANTPNLVDRFIIGASPANKAVGTTGGAATHTLTVAEMPAHDHDLKLNGSAGGDGTGVAWAGNTTQNAAAMLDRGGGQAHNNMPPYYALTYIIKK